LADPQFAARHDIGTKLQPNVADQVVPREVAGESGQLGVTACKPIAIDREERGDHPLEDRERRAAALGVLALATEYHPRLELRDDIVAPQSEADVIHHTEAAVAIVALAESVDVVVKRPVCILRSQPAPRSATIKP
jgi:hypothetical protein